MDVTECFFYSCKDHNWSISTHFEHGWLCSPQALYRHLLFINTWVWKKREISHITQVWIHLEYHRRHDNFPHYWPLWGNPWVIGYAGSRVVDLRRDDIILMGHPLWRLPKPSPLSSLMSICQDAWRFSTGMGIAVNCANYIDVMASEITANAIVLSTPSTIWPTTKKNENSACEKRVHVITSPWKIF